MPVIHEWTGTNLLKDACREGNLSLAQLLLERGIIVLRDYTYAVSYGHYDMTQLLLENGTRDLPMENKWASAYSERLLSHSFDSDSDVELEADSSPHV